MNLLNHLLSIRWRGLSALHIRIEVTKTASKVPLSIAPSNAPSSNSIALASICKSNWIYLLTFKIWTLIFVFLLHCLCNYMWNINICNILITFIKHLFTQPLHNQYKLYLNSLLQHLKAYFLEWNILKLNLSLL
mgnify:CR=1 FL=1